MKPACPLTDKKPRAELRIDSGVFTNYFGSYISPTKIVRRNMARKFTKLGVIVVLMIIALSGCASEKRCMKYYPPETIIKDSISYRERVVYRDTTIRVIIPGEVVHDSILIEVPKKAGQKLNTKVISKKTEYAEASAWVSENVLNLTLEQKDTAINVKLDSALRDATIWKEKYYSKQEVKTTPNRPAFIRGLGVGFIIGLAMVLLLLYFLSRFRTNT